MENTFINLDHVKKMLDNVESMRSSSDSVVRALTAVVREQSQYIAGIAAVMDYILTKQRDQDRQLLKTKYHVFKNAEKRLPEDCIFERRNFTRNWIWEEEKPFKKVNMLEVFEGWKSPHKNAKGHQFLRILDFYYLACDPITEIQNYACRQSGKKGKYEHLKDLPERLATFLIDFALDGLGLYEDALLKPTSELIRNPTIFWTNLEKDDEARVKKFDALSEFRMQWGVFARSALGRAPGDIRAYEMNPTRAELLPPKKKRVVVTTASLSPVKEVEKTSPDDDI